MICRVANLEPLVKAVRRIQAETIIDLEVAKLQPRLRECWTVNHKQVKRFRRKDGLQRPTQ